MLKGRQAGRVKPLVIALLAASALVAPAVAQAGFIARGTVEVPAATAGEARWQEMSGAITVEAWGPEHCRITVALDPVSGGQQYIAVLNGKRASRSGPQGAAAALNLALGGEAGCALLAGSVGVAPASAALAAPTLALDPATHWLAKASWQHLGHAIQASYADWSGGSARSVTLTSDGVVRLVVRFASVERHAGFTGADFALPSPPAPRTAAGGGR